MSDTTSSSFKISIEAADNASPQIAKPAAEIEQLKARLQDLLHSMQEHGAANDEFSGDMGAMKDAAYELEQALNELEQASKNNATDGVRELGTATDDLRNSLDDAGAAADGTADNLDRMADDAVSAARRTQSAGASYRAAARDIRAGSNDASDGLEGMAKGFKSTTEGITLVYSALGRVTQAVALFMTVYKATEWATRWVTGLKSVADQEDELRRKIDATNAAYKARQDYYDYFTQQRDAELRRESQKGIDTATATEGFAIPYETATDKTSSLADLLAQNQQRLKEADYLKSAALITWQSSSQQIESGAEGIELEQLKRTIEESSQRVQYQDRRIAALNEDIAALQTRLAVAQDQSTEAARDGYRRVPQPEALLDELTAPLDPNFIPRYGTPEAQESLRGRATPQPEAEGTDALNGLKSASAERAETDEQMSRDLQEVAQAMTRNNSTLLSQMQAMLNAQDSLALQLRDQGQLLSAVTYRINHMG